MFNNKKNYFLLFLVIFYFYLFFYNYKRKIIKNKILELKIIFKTYLKLLKIF